MEPGRAVRLTAQLAAALGYAHRQGILHRDVKPANAMLNEQDSLHLMDFGLAGWTQEESTRLTRLGAVMGTPAYMAPEQASGDTKNVGPAADLYSAGVVLYELLTSRLPFDAGHPAALGYLVVHTAPTPPSQHIPGLEAGLEAICLKAMAKKPEDRFASGEAMAAALADWTPAAPSAQPRPAEPTAPPMVWWKEALAPPAPELNKETIVPSSGRRDATRSKAAAARRPSVFVRETVVPASAKRSTLGSTPPAASSHTGPRPLSVDTRLDFLIGGGIGLVVAAVLLVVILRRPILGLFQQRDETAISEKTPLPFTPVVQQHDDRPQANLLPPPNAEQANDGQMLHVDTPVMQQHDDRPQANLLPPPPPPPIRKAVARLAAPNEAAVADADKKIKVVYKEEYAKKKPEEVKALASKLLGDGLDAKDDPASQFVLLREARDLSAKAGDAPSALLAAESLSDRFVVDAAEMRTLALEEVSRATLTSDARANVAALALAYTDDAVDADDYATAERLTKAARTAAESITNRSLERVVLDRASEVQELRTAYALVQDAVKTLATKPDDAAANLALGKFLCFDKGDWDRGLPMLALGSDAKLKELAVKDAAAPTDAAAQDELGNKYAELAKGETGADRKLHLLRRAGYWYKQAETGLTDLPHTEIVKKIADIDKTAPAAAPAVLFAAYGQKSDWTDHTIQMRVLLAQAKDQKLALKADAEELVGANPDAYPPKTWVVVYRYAEQVRLTTAATGEMVAISAPPDATPVTPAVGQTLTILYARYGAGFNWGDATAKAQELVKGATLTVKPGDLGFDDTATDNRKALVLVCRQGGRVRLSITGALEGAVLPDSANRFDAASRSVSADDVSGGNPVEITNGIRMKLRLIKPGTFLMGSANEEVGRDKIEGPQHEVEISKAFYMGVYPVTVAQFTAFVKADGYKTDAETNGKGGVAFVSAAGRWEQKATFTWQHPGCPAGDDYPVVQVSWNDATAFCVWLSKKEGKTYELPTEAEWEYACRAGTKTRFWCGEADVSPRGNANLADAALKKEFPRANYAVAWEDGYAFTSPVGSFHKNPWGLYDMVGNVWQWCADEYGPYQEGFIKDPTGAFGSPNHVLRGGSWNAPPRLCRSAWRRSLAPIGVSDDDGFRVVMRIPARTP